MADGTGSQEGRPAGLILLALLAPERLRLSLALGLALAAAAAELLPYALLSQSVGTVLAGSAAAGFLVTTAGLVGGALLLKHLLYSIAYYLSHVAAFRLLAGIRRTLVHRLAVAPPGWLERQGSGRLRTAVMQDVERLEQFIAHHTVECLAALVSPILVAVALAWIDARLALAALVTVPLAAGAQLVLMRGFRPWIDAYNEAIGDLNGAAVEYVRNAPVMKAFCQDARSFRHMRALLANYHRIVAMVTRRTVPGWSVFVVLLGANVLFLLPTSLWLHRQGIIGTAETVLAVMLGNGMLKPLFKVAHFASEIRGIAAGVRRFAPILDFPPPPHPPAQSLVLTDAIVFDRVSFSYDGRAVLKDLSFRLPVGGVTALVGPSGAGKSTVAHLLSGLSATDSGEIRVDSTPLSTLGADARSRLIAVATQEAFLFRGTLMDNLRLARPDADDDTVRRAVRIAQAEDMIAALPNGYGTRVGERGARLSGGERQRITIARALLSDAPVLVLDEATAFADSRTERRFFQALRQACPDRTLLVIAHRLTTIQQADQILVLDNGSLVGAGRHTDLIAHCPLYRTLWHRQFDGENWSIRPEENTDATVS